jgi:hypothetical protein
MSTRKRHENLKWHVRTLKKHVHREKGKVHQKRHMHLEKACAPNRQGAPKNAWCT